MMQAYGRQWVEIFESPNPTQVGALRSALEAEGIEYIVYGDRNIAHRGCAVLARVTVLREDLRRAATLVRGINGALGS